MNYGLAFASRGDYATGLEWFQRAKVFAPLYWPIETNMGVACTSLHLDSEAERHFAEAIRLAPGLADPYFYYGRWLASAGRADEAIRHLNTALRLNSRALGARHLLMELYARRRDWAALDLQSRETLRLDPEDDVAQHFEETRGNR